MITRSDAERALKGVGRMEDLPGTPYEAFQTIAVLYHKIERVERERDLAIDHDQQPYPTAWAYEQAVNALDAAHKKIEDLETQLAAARKAQQYREELGADVGVTVHKPTA